MISSRFSTNTTTPIGAERFKVATCPDHTRRFHMPGPTARLNRAVGDQIDGYGAAGCWSCATFVALLSRIYMQSMGGLPTPRYCKAFGTGAHSLGVVPASVAAA